MVDQGERRALQSFRWLEVEGNAAPDQLHQLQHHIGQAKGDQQLGHMPKLVNPAQAKPLKQRAERTHHQRRQHQRRPEPDPARQRVAHISAQHVKAGMGEVEHAHHAEDQGQPRTQHEKQQAIADAIERRDDEKLHVACPVSAQKPKRARTANRHGLCVTQSRIRDASSGSWSACSTHSWGTP